MSTHSKVPHDPTMRRYKRLHRRMMNFLQSVTIAPEKLLLNEYLRAENAVLREFLLRKESKIRWTEDEKILLSQKAIKFKRWHTNSISSLSLWQIQKYAQLQAGQTHVSLGPTKKSVKRMKSIDYQKEILKILKEHPRWGKYQILQAMRKKFPNIDRIFVWDLLLKMGFWDVRKNNGGIPWKQWLKRHEGVTWAGDFFSVNVWTEYSSIEYHVLFFIHLKTMRVVIGGITSNATETWLINILKSWTDGFCPLGPDAKFLVRDRDRRFTPQFDWYLACVGITPKKIAAGAPVMNCVAEQFVNNIKRDCLSHCVFFTEEALRKVVNMYLEYYHKYRPNRKYGGDCIMPEDTDGDFMGEIKKKSIIPGLLTTYYRAKA